MPRRFVAFLLAVSWCAPSARGQGEPPPQSLFDGSTLAGWRGDPAVWSVRDGCLVGCSVDRPLPANTFLVLDGQEPGDFEFTAEVRLDGDNNSGVQYRSRVVGDGFAVAGPQCDVHRAPRYTAMLYDERGAGIVAEHGQMVRWQDDGRTVLGELRRPRPLDLGQWRRLRIVARGELMWHELDGVPVTAVQDRRAAAPRQGVLALQVHAGAPMTVWFRRLQLREFADEAVAARQAPVPDAVRALLLADAARAATPRGEVPQWLWDESPSPDEELFFRREFTLPAMPAAARLAVACDNHCRVYVNGEKVGASDAWEAPLLVDPVTALRAGANVVAVHGWNDGGPAAMALRLSWTLDGREHELVSDGAWQCSGDDPEGWDRPGAAVAGFGPVRTLAALGEPGAPWSSVLGADALGTAVPADAPQLALVATELQWSDPGPEPEVLRLLQVPRALGSWVALAADGRGRLYASAQGGGLFRIAPAAVAGQATAIERVPVELVGAQGLVWWRDSLYAVGNGRGSGLYRLTDSDGDDRLDHVERLQTLDGDGEHGPHAVAVAPDGEHLLVLCGNHTKLPPLAASRVDTDWAEDRLLPRLSDPHPYWEGHSPPGGWVCQVDPHGRRWELLCCGLRNPYDLVVLPTGQVVTWDADMEWDMGLPWYRPTRLLAVHSGVDYGWRIGSAKWPADYPEAPPALLDVGPGSPTGMAWLDGPGGGLLSLDWTFGTVYRDGRPWCTGAPLPLTDVVVAAGDVFLLTGGRGLPSTLLRVRRAGAMASGGPADAARWGRPLPWPAAELRPAAAILAATAADGPVATRIALQRLPAGDLRAAALAIDAAQPARSLAGLLALARRGDGRDLEPVLAALGGLPFAALAPPDRIAWLRAHALALLRLGPASDAQRGAVAARLLPLFPTGDERQDQDLAELLAFVAAPGLPALLVPRLLPLRPTPAPTWAELTARNADYGRVIDAMAAAMPPTGQLALADALRTVRTGWTAELRRDYFTFLAAARQRRGGSSYDGFVRKIAAAAWADCTAAEQQQLAAVAAAALDGARPVRVRPPVGPGRTWRLADADLLLGEGLAGRDVESGRNLFHAAGCAGCHWLAGEGGNHGPDLTSLGSRFGARDVLEAILEPDRVISEQYAGQVLTRTDGGTLFGFVQAVRDGDRELYEVMPAAAGAEVVRVPAGDVARLERSARSPMPPNLVDRLSAHELRDLLAFLLRGAR